VGIQLLRGSIAVSFEEVGNDIPQIVERLPQPKGEQTWLSL
jgi:hypothetical protein